MCDTIVSPGKPYEKEKKYISAQFLGFRPFKRNFKEDTMLLYKTLQFFYLSYLCNCTMYIMIMCEIPIYLLPPAIA
jgi:hypothetical protein